MMIMVKILEVIGWYLLAFYCARGLLLDDYLDN